MLCKFAAAILGFGLVALNAATTLAAPSSLFDGSSAAKPSLIEPAQSSHCINWFKECVARQDQGRERFPGCMIRAGCSPNTRLHGRDQAAHCTSWVRECQARRYQREWELRRCVEGAGC